MAKLPVRVKNQVNVKKQVQIKDNVMVKNKVQIKEQILLLVSRFNWHNQSELQMWLPKKTNIVVSIKLVQSCSSLDC